MRDGQCDRELSGHEAFSPRGLLAGKPWKNSSLTSILDPKTPASYQLSRKAKDGILRRAAKRGRKLPDLLRRALEQ